MHINNDIRNLRMKKFPVLDSNCVKIVFMQLLFSGNTYFFIFMYTRSEFYSLSKTIMSYAL